MVESSFAKGVEVAAGSTLNPIQLVFARNAGHLLNYLRTLSGVRDLVEMKDLSNAPNAALRLLSQDCLKSSTWKVRSQCIWSRVESDGDQLHSQ